MNIPSCFISLQLFATLILPSKSATISNRPQEVLKGGCNETTHYSSKHGICCELCPAGSKKLMDCDSNKTGSFCTGCRAGEGYTDEPNSSNECKKCTVCNVTSEDTERRCTTKEDTRCRCRDGFQRAAPSDPCTEAKGDADVAGAVIGVLIGVAIGAVVLLILLVVTVGLLLYRIFRKRFPWESSHSTSETTLLNTDEEDVNSAEDFIGKMITSDQTGNWKDDERELPELREWIGKTPSLFLHELKKKNLVTEEAYWRAFTIPDAAKRADSILLPVMRRGEGECRELLEILEQQRSRERHFLDMLKTSHVCSPTLNPNSAHRQLQISADLSTVTWNQAAQPYSDHAERFESWPIVLCFETFSSGDHYWELDVRASENCSIGVARGSIPRKCQEKSGRLGWNESSWAFIKWDSNYSARHDGRCIPFPEIQHLQRVGVRLDFNAGKLSFYNASTTELLHSFDDISSEPLFPAMQVNSGSIMIYEVQSFKSLNVDESREDIQICDHFANGGVHRTKNTNAEKGDDKDALLRTTTEEPPVVRELIGRIPAMLHHELLVQGLITQSELSEVYSMPHASARADFIISCLDRKQEESPQLQEILSEHRENQEAFLKMRSESSTYSPTLNPNTVICSEKFSSGRHYWQVDVRGFKKFIIGVIYDAIPREAQSLKNLTMDGSREDIPICDHFANGGVHRTKNTDAEKSDSEHALIRTGMEEPPIVRDLIGRIPAMLHRELLIQDLITQSELSKVYSTSRASARADSMISRLDRNQEERPQLQEILREHREKQEAFLKMRSESSTCSPTLNPNTAHRNLHISADFKSVRTSTHTQPYPDNSDRFNHYRVVICAEKFSSGRHYWEVDVRGCDKFIIGVTYDAIPGKGDDKAYKIGYNEVSWSLKKWCNAYTALHKETETKLSVRDAPKRVGVHLDWEAGVLSFYSADSMSLLHQFHKKFDRELYPAMAVLRKSLSICPLPYADTHR